MGRKISELLGGVIGSPKVCDGEIIELKIDAAANAVTIIAGFFGGVDAEDICNTSGQIAKALKLGVLTIVPKIPPEFMTADYVASLCRVLKQKYPVFSLCDDAEFDLSGNVLTVSLRQGGKTLLEQQNAAQILINAINDTFGLRPAVEFGGTVTLDADSDEYRDMVAGQQQQELDYPQPPPEKERTVPQQPAEAEFSRPDEHIVEHEGRVKTVFAGHKLTEPAESIDSIYAGRKRENVVVEGKVFGVDIHPIKNGETIIFTFQITDGGNSIGCKMFLKGGRQELTELIKDGMPLKIGGRIETDSYTNSEVLMPQNINLGEEKIVTDDAERKRVELHLHTNMSQLDALPEATDVVKLAYKWGHRAVAITDHGVVQSFPDAMYAYEKIKKENPDADFKVIYGVEAYLVNDMSGTITGSSDTPLDGEFVVFDIETTGLSNVDDRITEIGAVLVRKGEVIDRFDTFVNPGRPIPDKIVKLTGITDEMVKDAPAESDAVARFIEFAGDRVLVAHNAEFDTGFMRVAYKRCGLTFENCYIDTLAAARALYPGLAKYSLDKLGEHLELGEFNHHRACDDAEMLAAVFAKMLDRFNGEGCKLVGDIDSFLAGGTVTNLPTYHCIILVKNQKGLRNLYEIISDSHIKYFHSRPRVPKSLLTQKREGLIIGSACEAGELYNSIENNFDIGKQFRIAEFYDYLEIQPLANNEFLIRDGKVRDKQQLIEYNKKIIYFGKKLNKPVVATCDVHFLSPADAKFREIMLTAKKMSDAKFRTPLYFRTTNEMLAEFSYLTPEEAQRVVIDNPNAIADMVEVVRPIPEGTFPPSIDGADEQFSQIIATNARRLYGDPLPKVVADRIERELTPVMKNGYSVLYLVAQKLAANSNQAGYMVGSRGSVGSTVLAFLGGISEVNPLPAHYRCPKCAFSDFDVVSPTGVGPDMPPRDCPKCGAPMIADGLEIPFETFLGFSGEKAPDIDLNFSNEYQSHAHKYTEEIFGSENCYKAGTISAVKEQIAFGYVSAYCEENGITVSKAEKQRLAEGCTGVKTTTGQHPGGIVVVPKGRDINEFTPVQYPANKKESGIITTHFDFNSMHDTLLKLDELGHVLPTQFKYLRDITGVDFADVPLGDPDVMKLFSSTEPLGVTPEQIDSNVGTLGLPDMGTDFVRKMLYECQPKTFADLLQISGLSHGTDVWLGNAQELIKNGTCTISTVIGLRDNIMLYLMKQGLEPKLAFKITEYVRKKPARKLTPEFIEVMKAHDVPDWYIESCGKIAYMFPKAHAGAYVTSAIKLGWFKYHYPLEFYSTYFTVRGDDIDYDSAVGGITVTRAKMAAIDAKGKEATAKEKNTYEMSQILVEMFARGFSFSPVDIIKSDATIYKIEDGKIRLPFIAISGVGENAARMIAAARDKDCHTVEEYADIGGIPPSLIETLKTLGAFGDIPDSNQLTLF